MDHLAGLDVSVKETNSTEIDLGSFTEWVALR
jgi:hypothetical protein